MVVRTSAIETFIRSEFERRISAIDVSLKALENESKSAQVKFNAIDAFTQSDQTPQIHEICTKIMSDPSTKFNKVQIEQAVQMQDFEIDLKRSFRLHGSPNTTSS